MRSAGALQVGNKCIVDCSSPEESCVLGALQVAVGPKGQICGVTKAGSRGLHPAVTQDMLEMAQKLGPKLITAIDALVASASS